MFKPSTFFGLYPIFKSLFPTLLFKFANLKYDDEARILQKKKKKKKNKNKISFSKNKFTRNLGIVDGISVDF